MLTFPLVIANIVSNSMEDYQGQWPAPTLRRQNAMPYGGHASAQPLSQQTPAHAAHNTAGPVENVAPAQSIPVLNGGYQFLGESSILQEQPDLSRPPPSLLVEVNSSMIAAPPAQNTAANNRGNVKDSFSHKSTIGHCNSSSKISFNSRQLAKSTDALCPPPLLPKFRAENLP